MAAMKHNGLRQGGAPRWQDVWANIWNAVLAVGLPVVIKVNGWRCPEVLLSLLPSASLGLYRARSETGPIPCGTDGVDPPQPILGGWLDWGGLRAGQQVFEFAPALLQLAVMIEGRRIFRRPLNRLGFLRLDALDAQAMDEVL